MLGAKVDVGLWLVCKRSVSWLVTTSRLTSWPATLGWPAPSRPEQRSIPRKCNNQTYPGSFPGTSASAQQAAGCTLDFSNCDMYLNNQYTIIRKHEDNFPCRKHLNWDACVERSSWTPPVSEGFMETCQICRHFQQVECSAHSPWRMSKGKKILHNFWHQFWPLFTKGNNNWWVPEM